jgi:hypothetical protein
MKKFPNENRQVEIIKEIEIAEEKARRMAEFAINMNNKWQSRLIDSKKQEEIKS